MSLKLPIQFNRWGQRWQLLKRIGDWACYRQSFRLGTERYCTVRIRQYKKDKPERNIKAGKEYLPGPELYGKDGFQFLTEEPAREKLRELVQREVEKHKEEIIKHPETITSL